MHTFNSLLEALEVAQDETKMDTDEWRDAVAYILENAPEDLQQILREKLRECFPELTPDYVDDKGQHYYSLSKLQKNLGMTDKEMEEAAAAMLKRRGDKAVTSEIPTLHRIQ